MAGRRAGAVSGTPRWWRSGARRAGAGPEREGRSSSARRPRRGSRCSPGPSSTGRTRSARWAAGEAPDGRAARTASAAIPGACGTARSLSRSSSRAMAALSSASKHVRWRSAARIQRSTTCTATSTFALSRGVGPARAVCHAVVSGQVVVGRVDVGLVAMGRLTAERRLSGITNSGQPPKRTHERAMPSSPEGSASRSPRRRYLDAPSTATKTERLALLAGLAVHHRDGLSGVVNIFSPARCSWRIRIWGSVARRPQTPGTARRTG